MVIDLLPWLSIVSKAVIILIGVFIITLIICYFTLGKFRRW